MKTHIIQKEMKCLKILNNTTLMKTDLEKYIHKNISFNKIKIQNLIILEKNIEAI